MSKSAVLSVLIASVASQVADTTAPYECTVTDCTGATVPTDADTNADCSNVASPEWVTPSLLKVGTDAVADEECLNLKIYKFTPAAFDPTLPYVCENATLDCAVAPTAATAAAMGCTNDVSENDKSAFIVSGTETYIVTGHTDGNSALKTTPLEVGFDYCEKDTVRVANLSKVKTLTATTNQVCVDSAKTCPFTAASETATCHNLKVEDACDAKYLYRALNDANGAVVVTKYDAATGTCSVVSDLSLIVAVGDDQCSGKSLVTGASLVSVDDAGLCDCTTASETCQVIAPVAGTCATGYKRSYKLTGLDAFTLYDENCKVVESGLKKDVCSAGKNKIKNLPTVGPLIERQEVVATGVASDLKIAFAATAPTTGCDTTLYYTGLQTSGSTTYIDALDTSCNPVTNQSVTVTTATATTLNTFTVGANKYYVKNLYAEAPSATAATMTTDLDAVPAADIATCASSCTTNLINVVQSASTTVQAVPITGTATIQARPDRSGVNSFMPYVSITPGSGMAALNGAAIPGTTGCTAESVYLAVTPTTLGSQNLAEVSFYGVPNSACTDHNALTTPLAVKDLSEAESISLNFPVTQFGADVLTGSNSVSCKYLDTATGLYSTEGVKTVVDTAVNNAVTCVSTHTTPFGPIVAAIDASTTTPYYCTYTDDDCTTQDVCGNLFDAVVAPATATDAVYYYSTSTTAATVTMDDSTTTPVTSISLSFPGSNTCVSKMKIFNVDITTTTTAAPSDEGNNAAVPSVIVATMAAFAVSTRF